MDSMDCEIAEIDEESIKLVQELASLTLDSEQSPLMNTQGQHYLGSLSLDCEQLPLINPQGQHYLGSLHDEKLEYAQKLRKIKKLLFFLKKLKELPDKGRDFVGKLKHADVQKLRNINKLLFIFKNLKELSDKGRDFVGAGPLFNCILSLLMQPDLQEKDKRVVLKLTNRGVYGLNEIVRPYVHEILSVIQPMLIHECYYTDGREIIYNLTNGAGLETVITAMHRNIDSINENVKQTTWITFNVVASTHGISVLLPFLEAVCQDSKSWHTRCTGMKIVGQFVVQMGSEAVLHLKELVGIIRNGLSDENDRVKIMTGLCIAALAQAAEGCPDGIYGFEFVLNPMLTYIFKTRGRARSGEVCAAFLKAFVSLIRLMDGASACYFAVEVVVSLYGGEFGSPYGEEIKETVMTLMEKFEITFD